MCVVQYCTSFEHFLRILTKLGNSEFVQRMPRAPSVGAVRKAIACYSTVTVASSFFPILIPGYRCYNISLRFLLLWVSNVQKIPVKPNLVGYCLNAPVSYKYCTVQYW